MTTEELKIAKALCYDANFYQQSKAGKFILDMGERVFSEPEYQLSEKQQAFLFALLHTYRKQLPDLHKEHCRDKECRRTMKNEEEKAASQLVLF